MSYWLMKSEPEVFGIDHLKRRPDQSEPWDGVRNYQVRNMLRDQMRPGDLAFFYHSNCEEPGIAGIMKVVGEARPDPSAFDPDAKYFDPRSDPANPRWYLVDMRYVRHLRRNIPLRELRQHAAQLDGLALLRKGSRLSIMPVSKEHWEYILELE